MCGTELESLLFKKNMPQIIVMITI